MVGCDSKVRKEMLWSYEGNKLGTVREGANKEHMCLDAGAQGVRLSTCSKAAPLELVPVVESFGQYNEHAIGTVVVRVSEPCKTFECDWKMGNKKGVGTSAEDCCEYCPAQCPKGTVYLGGGDRGCCGPTCSAFTCPEGTVRWREEEDGATKDECCLELKKVGHCQWRKATGWAYQNADGVASGQPLEALLGHCQQDPKCLAVEPEYGLLISDKGMGFMRSFSSGSTYFNRSCDENGKSAETGKSTGTGKSYAGEYGVRYGGRKRHGVVMVIDCSNRVSGNGGETKLELEGTDHLCGDERRDSKATMFLMNVHGNGKFECLWTLGEGTTIYGNHYTGPGRFWGEVRYDLITRTPCDGE